MSLYLSRNLQHPKTQLRFDFIGIHMLIMSSKAKNYDFYEHINGTPEMVTKNSVILTRALFFTPPSWDEEWWMTLNRNCLISVLDHWQGKAPEMSLHWELNWETLQHVWLIGIGQKLEIHLALACFEWVQTYFTITHSKSPVLLAARGSHGPQQFSGWKYLPPHRGLAVLNVKRVICEALFWDLFTNFHAKFILTHVLVPLWQVLWRDTEIITSLK